MCEFLWSYLCHRVPQVSPIPFLQSHVLCYCKCMLQTHVGASCLFLVPSVLSVAAAAAAIACVWCQSLCYFLAACLYLKCFSHVQFRLCVWSVLSNSGYSTAVSRVLWCLTNFVGESDLAQDECICPESMARNASWNFFDCLIDLYIMLNMLRRRSSQEFFLGRTLHRSFRE